MRKQAKLKHSKINKNSASMRQHNVPKITEHVSQVHYHEHFMCPATCPSKQERVSGHNELVCARDGILEKCKPFPKAEPLVHSGIINSAILGSKNWNIFPREILLILKKHFFKKHLRRPGPATRDQNKGPGPKFGPRAQARAMLPP